jgi:hemoglobin-like flavoprotein
LAAYLQALGRRHHGYGAEPAHYEAVGEVLLDSLAHIAGDAWTDEARQAWTDAYAVVADVMIGAALAPFSEAADEAA